MPLDVSFFDTLKTLVELEHQAQREKLAEGRRTLPLAELEARGLVVLDVEATEFATGLGGRTLVSLKKERSFRSAIGQGDLVSVAPRKAPLDQPPTGVVTQARRGLLQIAFDRPPPPWLSEGRLRVDVLANDVTVERLRKALGLAKAMTHGQALDRRAVWLGEKPPRFERRTPNQAARALNPEQLDAVALALSARDVALVHGPPGTGKSTVLGEIALQAVRRGQRVLCTAASNAAVDHLLDVALEAGLSAVRVGHPARVMPRLQEHTVDLMVENEEPRILARAQFEEAFDLLGYASRQRNQGRSRSRFANAREAQTEAYRLMDDARKLERQAVRAVMERARVVCATLSMLDGSLLEGESFDLALVDEATQAIEPATLWAFLKAPVVVLAGDPMQLPPTVISPEAAKRGLSVSMFERLRQSLPAEAGCMLKEQHRMHQVLMTFPSTRMYQGQLRAHPDAAQRDLRPLLARPIDAPPVLFVDTAGKGFDEKQGEASESLTNSGEADVIVARVRALLNAGLSEADVAVITPYRAQASLLREQLAHLAGLEVDTVDAFQGREKEAVLVSLVRSNTEQQVGFLSDVRRMNVAMTRARRHLFLVGDSATLSGHEYYAAFIEYVQANDGYRSAWEWPELNDVSTD
jgi:ATP-dependent RNA/DNA helicase IGHMBP2